MSGSPHNIVGVTVAFDYVNKTFTFNVRMRNKLSAETIQQRAEKQGLLNPSNLIRASVRDQRRSVQITLSGPALEGIYRALPLIPPRRKESGQLTLSMVDARVEAFNRTAVPSAKSQFNGKDMMNIVAALCA